MASTFDAVLKPQLLCGVSKNIQETFPVQREIAGHHKPPKPRKEWDYWKVIPGRGGLRFMSEEDERVMCLWDCQKAEEGILAETELPAASVCPIREESSRLVTISWVWVNSLPVTCEYSQLQMWVIEKHWLFAQFVRRIRIKNFKSTWIS